MMCPVIILDQNIVIELKKKGIYSASNSSVRNYTSKKRTLFKNTLIFRTPVV